MRESKLRGKRKDNGEWVCGYYFVTPLTDESTASKPEDGWFFLTGKQRHCISRNGAVFEIDPDTLGQFTGFKDLYQDDICTDGQCTVQIVWMDTHAWGCKVLKGCALSRGCSFPLWQWDNCPRNNFMELTKIGNIHDNPELMEDIK